jgi:hypothetical protein
MGFCYPHRRGKLSSHHVLSDSLELFRHSGRMRTVPIKDANGESCGAKRLVYRDDQVAHGFNERHPMRIQEAPG